MPLLTRAVYKYLLRPVLFSLDAEKIHNQFLDVGENLGKNFITQLSTAYLFRYENSMLNQTIDGVFYKNPVGLAAGFDKNIRLTQILPYVGFGFMEGGSITLGSYGGNPPPKLVRLPKSKSIIVYYGLENNGSGEILSRLSEIDIDFPLGISIAKTNSKDTSTVGGGIADYTECFRKVVESGIGSYITINISCPNAFGGEPFTDTRSLEKLFKSLDRIKTKKPIYVKMPCDLSEKDTGELLEVLEKHNVQGVIISNLTKDRENPRLHKSEYLTAKNTKGGISGKMTEYNSNRLIRFAYENFGKTASRKGNGFTIIGCGGVFSAEDAFKKITLGADLIQLITGMIFEGPQLIGDINRGLVKLLEKNGFKNIKEAVGTSVKGDNLTI